MTNSGNHADFFRTRLAGRAAVVFLLGILSHAFCQNALHADSRPAGRNYAIIIAVPKYDDHGIPSLPFTYHDASLLASTLHLRGGYEILPLYEKINSGPPSVTSPTKENIERFVEDALGKCGTDDTVLLYFSGHGAADRNDPNKTYLLPRDCVSSDLPGTSVPSSWLRDKLTSCKASTKLLFIDACHSGGEKSAAAETFSLTSQELAGSEMEGVVTIASCTKDQRSYLWPEKGISLFSYWLDEAIKGHADKDKSGSVTVDELHEFLHRNVTKTATDVIGEKQTPVRIVKSDVSGIPVVIQPKAISLDTLLDDVANHIATEMKIWDVKKTGILEFMVQTPTGIHLDREKYGLLPFYCAEQLELRIRERLPKKRDYVVAAREAVQSALKQRGLDVDDLFSDKIAGKPLKIGNNTLESFIIGVIQQQEGADVQLQCKLLDLSGMNTLAFAGGKAKLNESEWAMLGRSAESPPATAPTRRPDSTDKDEIVEVVDATRIVTTPASFRTTNVSSRTARRTQTAQAPPLPKPTIVDIKKIKTLEQESQKPSSHPLSRQAKKFDVEIQVRDSEGRFRPCPFAYRQGQAYVPLRSGDVFKLLFRNGYANEVGVRVLVDGLNTLPEKSILPTVAKFAIDPDDEDLGNEDGEQPDVIAPAVNLDRAKFWVMRPRIQYQIPGFFSSTGKAAEGREFRVTDADQSEAAKKRFTDQIGIITVAVYTLREQEPGTRSGGNRGDFGIELGDSFTADIKTRPNLEIDQLLQVIHLHYPAP